MQTLHPRIVGFHEFPQNGFREHIKHPDGLPYIPGSEIKGALRNAVLFAMLNDQKYNGTLKQYLQAVQAAPQNERGRQLQKVAEKTESALLRTQGHADDAKYDLLRFVSISDTQPFTQQSALYIEKTRAVNTNRNTVMYLEAVYSDQGSATFEIRYGAPEKVISEINLTELRDWLKPERLLKACYEYSNAILDEEAGYFQNTFPNEKISGKIEYLKKENEEKRPLLRLGAGQGFLSVTIDLKVKQRDPQLYELIRKIASNISRRRWNTYQYNFPKTRRVIVTDNEPDTLLGWVKIVRTQSNSEKEAKSGS
jgi:CRISPR-associated protein Csm5